MRISHGAVRNAGQGASPGNGDQRTVQRYQRVTALWPEVLNTGQFLTNLTDGIEAGAETLLQHLQSAAADALQFWGTLAGCFTSLQYSFRV